LNEDAVDLIAAVQVVNLAEQFNCADVFGQVNLF